MRHLSALLLVLLALARDAAALRTPLITAKITGGEKRVAETFGPYEHLRAASLDECVAAAPFFCDKLQAPLDEEIQRGLDAMLGSANGVRGFFLVWNNEPNFVIADESPPPPGLLSSMEQARGAPDPTGFTCMCVCVRACVRVRARCGVTMPCSVPRAGVLQAGAHGLHGLTLTLTLTLSLTKACCKPGPTDFMAKTLLANIAMPAAAACALKRDGGSEAGEQARGCTPNRLR